MIKQLFFILLSAFAAADLHSITSDDLRNLSDSTRRDPCSPSPCGPNSQCHVINGQSEYRCSPAHTLTPPELGPACTSSSECPRNRACINQNCKDPCPGICVLNTRCETINHNPACICKPGFAGDPFVHCYEIMVPASILVSLPHALSCNSSTCGPNARCTTDMHGNPACLCLSGFIGSPPNCLPECVVNGDCPSNLARSKLQCRDPCAESCGIGAEFHFPLCVCPENFTGDPYVKCSLLTSSSPAEPECVLDADCPKDRVCIGSKCEDLCPRACGRNAVCNVGNHRAICTSPPGILGNILINYFLIKVPDKTDPCNPSPCGLNSQCRRINEQTVCSCMPDYLGVPPNCQPIQSDSCKSDTDCAASMECFHKKCVDPCPGTCGLNAICETINHNPRCTCGTGFTGDPFERCSEIIRPVPLP